MSDEEFPGYSASDYQEPSCRQCGDRGYYARGVPVHEETNWVKWEYVRCACLAMPETAEYFIRFENDRLRAKRNLYRGVRESERQQRAARKLGRIDAEMDRMESAADILEDHLIRAIEPPEPESAD